MRSQALYLNGIFRKVLDDIAKHHATRPELQLYLQPYSEVAIAYLRDNPPDKSDPVRLYASTSADLERVSYVADIIRWEDKTTIPEHRRERIRKRLEDFQPNEGGLYNVPEDGISRNLLTVVRMQRLGEPFSVTKLIKTVDNQPLGVRSTAGGWAYVFAQPGSPKA